MKKIAFIGAGAMAEAVLAGLVNKEFLPNEQIAVTNRENEERLTEIQEKYGVSVSGDKEAVLTDADVVFIATKPYDLESALQDVKPYVNDQQLFISVVAGISTTYIEEVLEVSAPIIRSMPNTSATIGLSATAIAKGARALDEHVQIAADIFSAIGTVSIVEEEQMHIVTAISGSGPAYIYYFVEAMQEVAEEAGLSKEVAEQLINQTVVGAGTMLSESSLPAATLRENVTSPNGTTAAGLETLAAHHFQEAVKACVTSAKERSKALGKDK